MNKKLTCIIIAALIVTCLIAYGRILNNDFVNFDDNVYITENNHVKSGLNAATVKWAFTSVVSSNWHPLTLLSHTLDWSLFKEHAGGHHFISLLLHISSALLLFLFLDKTTQAPWISAFVAALYALHPLRVESVAWAAERKDVLSMFFGTATLYAYSFYVEKQLLSRYFLCLILFALGLMSKSMLVTLPFVFILLDFWPLQRWQKVSNDKSLPSRADNMATKKKVKKKKIMEKISAKSKKVNYAVSFYIWEKIPFLFLAIVSSFMTLWAQNKGGAVASLQKLPFSERAVNAIVSYAAYLGKFFWPVDLAVLYPYRHYYPGWQIAGAFLTLLAISIMVIYLNKKTPFLLVGWFWYLGTLVPVIGLVQVGRQAMADRYTYLPTIGIAVMVAWGIAYLLTEEKRLIKIFSALAAMVITALTILTCHQCGYWRNSIDLFEHALKVTKNNYVIHTNLGITLAADGRIEEAIYNYNEAIKINANYDGAHYNLANALVKQGKIDEAISHYKQAITINPRYSKAQNNLGINLVKQRKFDEAIYHFQQALQMEPNNPGLYLNLGTALADRGNLQEAIENLRMAVYLNPNYDDARRALRMVLEIQKRQKIIN